MAKRKTLPKDFGDMLKTASLDELTAVFNTCLLDARGGYGKHTAIGFLDCPDQLIVWLADQGLDVDAADTYNATPLWERASMGWADQIPLLLSLGADIERRRSGGVTPLHGAAGGQRIATTRVLIDHGADVHAVTDMPGETPLLYALRRTRNASIAEAAEVASLLLDAGATVTGEARIEVERIGKEFEAFRESFSPDSVDEADAGLQRLYALLDVAPVARRVIHDGVSPIEVPGGPWPEQHEALWELLVPSSGTAATVQGEVIRITGRVANELLGNGGINWDRDFKAMLNTLPEHFADGTALSGDELAEARTLVAALRSGGGNDGQIKRLCQLAVIWVTNNTDPLALATPAYRR